MLNNQTITVDRQALLDVVRKIDFDAHDVDRARFVEAFDKLRLAFTPEEVATGVLEAKETV